MLSKKHFLLIYCFRMMLVFNPDAHLILISVLSDSIIKLFVVVYSFFCFTVSAGLNNRNAQDDFKVYSYIWLFASERGMGQARG